LILNNKISVTKAFAVGILPLHLL